MPSLVEYKTVNIGKRIIFILTNHAAAERVLYFMG